MNFIINKIALNIKNISLIFFIWVFVSGINAQQKNNNKEIKDSVSLKDTSSKSSDSMHTPEEMFVSCAKCHTIGKGKLIGPDLLGIKDRRDSAWLVNFIRSSDSLINSGDTAAKRLFLAYEKLPMPDNDFSPEEINLLIDYIIFEGNKLKADPNFLDNTINYAPKSNFWLFILGILLILLTLIELAFTKFIKYKLINVFIIIIGFGICGKVVFEEATYIGRSLGYEPDQPIKFSHRQHAGDYKINCLYCHPGVNKSRYAGIPATTLCLNCHNVIRYGTNTAEEEIDKIHKAVDDGKSIPWVKVYNLPDYVFFSHVQHVKVGKIDCKICHGDVADMGRIQQVVDLSMGWCMNCHTQTEVKFDNKYYTLYKQHDELKAGTIKKVTVADIGGNNCQKCHY